jgi:hypothetical protein
MMLFQDGSTHAWLASQPALDLVVTLDDATEEEGTSSSFLGLHEVIAANGPFSCSYTDRGSHYFLTLAAGGQVDRLHPTQVNRALAELKIEHIASYSPEGPWAHGARVRSSAAAPAATSAAQWHNHDGGKPLPGPDLPARTQRPLPVAAAEAGSAFGPFVGALDDILCIKEERVVSRDNCVRYSNRVLQIPEQAHRHHYVKATVQCPRIPGRWPGRLPRPALPGALPPHGQACSRGRGPSAA